MAAEQKIAIFSCITVLFDALPALPKCSQYVKVVRSEQSAPEPWLCLFVGLPGVVVLVSSGAGEA